MTTEEMTAEKLLRRIEDVLFKDMNLSRQVASLDAEGRRELMLRETDRLLQGSIYGDEAAWLSDQFWTFDSELQLRMDDHPLLASATEPWEQEATGLGDDDYQEALWLIATARLCHDLTTHTAFEQRIVDDRLSGEDFSYGQEPLLKWLRETPYRRIAVLVARIMLDTEADRAMATNQAVQDYYAYACYRETLDLRDVSDCEDHLTKWLGAMEEMRQHHERGLEKGLTEEEIRVADALWESVPHDFADDVVGCARAFCQQAEALLPERPYIASEKGCQQYIQKTLPVLHEIADRWEMVFDEHDAANLAASYTAAWLQDKYNSSNQ